MFEEYSLEVSRIFKWAEKEMFLLKHPYVGTEHLLLSLLKNSEDVATIMQKYNVTYESFKKELISIIGMSSKKSICVLWTPLLKKVVLNAKPDGRELEPIDLLTSLVVEDEGIAIRILISMNVDLEKLLLDLKNNSSNSNEIYTIGSDLQKKVNNSEKVIGRDKEINRIIEILIRKNKNNPLLLGESGVGKTAIVEELARRINKGNVPNDIKNKKIVMLSMSSLVAGTKYRGEFEEKLNKIIKELEDNQDIILFIDEVHTMVNAGGAEGAINAADILKPYMARGLIHIIGATTTYEYNKYVLKDKALARRFEIVPVLEPDLNETFEIIKSIKDDFENHYNVEINDSNIRVLVNATDKYIKNKCNPDKSISVLDSLCAKKSISDYETKNIFLEEKLDRIKLSKRLMVKNGDFNKAIVLYKEEHKLEDALNNNPKKVISDKEIIDYIKSCYNLDKEFTDKDFKNLLINLEKDIIGQEQQIVRIINNLKEHHDNKPISLLLTGSTGVGKTETVKLISNYLNIPLIRLDMTEYSDASSINHLIGASAGYIGYDDSNAFDKIKLEPRSIILFDEIEKASKSVINLLLQILDEGIITNRKGEKIDFSHSIIFMTSNAVANKKIGFVKQQGGYEGFFTKEFIARITDIIEYKDITKDMLKVYLKRHGIKDISILNNYDYKRLGFRGLNKMIHV